MDKLHPTIIRSKVLTASEERALLELYLDGRKAQEQLAQSHTAHQEQQLCSRVASGQKALDELVRSYVPFVTSIALRYRHLTRSMTVDDLIEEGIIGLIESFSRYDNRTDYRLLTYAFWHIRRMIRLAICNTDRVIRLPVHLIEKVATIEKSRKRLMAELGRNPTEAEIASECQVSIESLRQTLRYAQLEPIKYDFSHQFQCSELRNSLLSHYPDQNDIFLDIRQYISRESVVLLYLDKCEDVQDEFLLSDFILNEDDTLKPDYSAEQKTLRELLNNLIDDVLSKQESVVIMLRFGMEDGVCLGLEDVGRTLNITGERAHQIEVNALRKLRHPLRSRKLRDYLG